MGKQYSEIEDLEDDIDFLYIENTNVIQLPELSASLQVLKINNNQLTSLPELPDELGELKANDNQLTSLPDLPDELGVLEVNNNQLTSLPDLPDELGVLEACNNKLTTCPNISGHSFQRLYLSHNPFTKIKEELQKFIDYIKDHPDCDHDLYDIKDFRALRALKLTSKNPLNKLPIPNNTTRKIISFLKGTEAGKNTKRNNKTKRRKLKKEENQLKIDLKATNMYIYKCCQSNICINETKVFNSKNTDTCIM